MKTFTVNYDIGDNVYIPELERPGKVTSIWIVSKGIRYEVRYFHDGKLNEVYFTEEELKEKK